jgi:hypothetical protein
MLEKFKQWLEEVEFAAIERKKKAAVSEGDLTQWKRQIWRAPAKNRDIKTKFHQEALNLKLGVRSRPTFGIEKPSREWLYDFVWRRFDSENNLSEIVLVMEIEMSDLTECTSRHDFNKLLQADSTYKIFVFQMKTEEQIQSEFEQLKTKAARYRFRFDSEFLLCGWSTKENKFFFDSFEARPAPLAISA